MSIMPSPSNSFFKDVETLLFKFLWNNKHDRIKRVVLYPLIEDGGINMPHLQSYNYALKLAWLHRLLNEETSGSWKSLVLHNMPMKNELMWQCNLKLEDVGLLLQNIKNKFWQDVVKSWCTYNFQEPENVSDMRKQSIWYNSFIKIDKKVLFYKKWF